MYTQRDNNTFFRLKASICIVCRRAHCTSHTNQLPNQKPKSCSVTSLVQQKSARLVFILKCFCLMEDKRASSRTAVQHRFRTQRQIASCTQHISQKFGYFQFAQLELRLTITDLCISCEKFVQQKNWSRTINFEQKDKAQILEWMSRSRTHTHTHTHTHVHTHWQRQTHFLLTGCVMVKTFLLSSASAASATVPASFRSITRPPATSSRVWHMRFPPWMKK